MGLDGDLTATEARSLGQELVESIAEKTQLPIRTVRRRLDGARGNALVRNIFVDEWPDLVGELNRYTVANARRQDLSERIGRATGLDPRLVQYILDTAEGQTLLPNAFAAFWPGNGDRDSRDTTAHNLLLNLRVSQVYEYDLFKALGIMSHLTERNVRDQLQDVRKNSLIKNVLSKEPSSDPAGDAEDGGVDAARMGLLDLRISWARGNNDVIADIARLTGLSLRTVSGRLDSTNGNSLVRNLFAGQWLETPSSVVESEIDSSTAKDASEKSIGFWRASQAIEHGLAGEISKILGLGLSTVQRRLGEARGNTLIKNIFPGYDASFQLPPQDSETSGSAGSASALKDTSHAGASAEPLAPISATPRLPPPLVEAYRTGKLALFLGSGLSLGNDVQGNLPTWSQIPERLLDACDRFDALDLGAIESKRNGFKVRMSLEQMLSEIGTLRTALRRDYQAALNAIFRPIDAAPGAAHRTVATLDVRAILTTNYDQLLEKVAETPSRQPYTWKEADHALSELRAGRKVLLKVHGTAERHETVVMSEVEYHRARSDASYQAVLRYLLQDHVFLFVGYGMNDPLDLDLAFSGNAEAFKSAAQRHYLLLQNPTDADRDRYYRDYNVRVIPYAEHREVPEILARLAMSKAVPA